ncbi:MAG TPA: aspartate kinase, partial [Sphaerochaeta sp.]|nr:aspartate kinase [Sphaerochaeta sp.]
MKTKTLKFGGSSLADSAQFRKVSRIIHEQTGRVYVVASAPGKRNREDTKVTDMLYDCYELAKAGKDFGPRLSEIQTRFSDIAKDLGADFDCAAEFETIRKHLSSGPERDYMASRGEYLNSKLLASSLGFDFVDPATCVFFNADGTLNATKTNEVLGKALEGTDKAVVAGFYGLGSEGHIKTFSRGGSDVTGAIVARASKSDVYENWTDVSG